MYRKQAHIHFVGIGGIGMSGIATILRSQGYTVSGCDIDLEQKSILNLIALGCHIFHGNNTPSCLTSADVVVYSSAIQSAYPELIRARQLGVPTIPRAVMLAELMRTKFSVAISGSHGKTTTTSLISHILIELGYDPTVIIGGHLKNLSSNARLGKGEFLIAEADESDRSLLRLRPTFAVVTNISFEHVETYKDLDDVKETFGKFLESLPFYGKAFVCSDDANIQSLLPLAYVKAVTYGLNTQADIQAKNIVLKPSHVLCDVYGAKGTQLLGQVTLHMAGQHNILNCLAAIAFCIDLDIPFDHITQAIASFRGVERRFSYHGTYQGAEIFDDYGHHPHELFCTFQAARIRARNKLVVVFQPHRYTRTQGLWKEFLETFKKSPLDALIITDIYAAGETPIAHVSSHALYQDLQSLGLPYPIFYAPYEPQFDSIRLALNAIAGKNDLILAQGAGKIHQLAYLLASKITI
jgi:UDP-N-acetylmuramate--alanine ligase